MYLDYVIQAQIMPISNLPPDLDLETYKFWDNEVLIYTPLYSSQNGLYRGLRKKLGYVTLRCDTDETFYSYGLDKERSKTLFCVNKQPLPNIFQCTAFKKHWSFLLDQNQENLEFSKMFCLYHQFWIVRKKFNNIIIMLIYTQLMLVMIILRL